MSGYFFTGKANYRAWDIKPINPLDVPREELLLHLVGWAVLAPNSHNVQPWRFCINPSINTVSICVDGEYILSASDRAGRQAYISAGCALENVLFAAEAYGLEFEVEDKLGSPLYPDPIAVVNFKIPNRSAKGIKLELLEDIRQRKMNRGKYDPLRQIPKFLVQEVENFTNNLGLFLDIIKDAATRFAIAEIQYLADRAVIIRNDFRNELARFLLPNDTIMFRGMPGNTFGLSDGMAARIHEELKKTGSFDPDFAFGFAASGRDGIKSAPALLIISVREDIPLWWAKAGRTLERIALVVQNQGLGMAIHAAMVEVEMFNKLLKLRLRRKERPTVICRVGYATEVRPHAPRVCAKELTEIVHL